MEKLVLNAELAECVKIDLASVLTLPLPQNVEVIEHPTRRDWEELSFVVFRPLCVLTREVLGTLGVIALWLG